jgi:hypothetical protein
MSDAATSEYYRDYTSDRQGRRVLIGLTFKETNELESLFKLSAQLDKSPEFISLHVAKAATIRLRRLLKKHIDARNRMWTGIKI